MENITNLQDIRAGYYSIGEFDGQERFVRFDLNAFAEMERIYGSMEAANEALSKGSMRDVRMVLWLGLIHDHAVLDEVTGEPVRYTLTPYQVGGWLTPLNLKEVMSKLNKAISGTLPNDNATPDGMTPAQAAAIAQAEEASGEPAKIFPAPNVSE